MVKETKEQELTLTLTGGEAQALISLIDIATKHPQLGGMSVAKAAVHLQEKIVQAAQEAGFQTSVPTQGNQLPNQPNGRQAARV